MTKTHPRTIVYIDGFNLYYGCLKGTSYRWLDVCAFADRLLPRNHVIAVKYFTARVSDTTDDPQQSTRQDTYLRALQAQPRLSLIEGTFLFKRRRLRLAPEQKGAPATVDVQVAEEKGSDVNLAVHLLHDGHLGRYDAAVVISNDSDLKLPVDLARQRVPVGLVNPAGGYFAGDLTGKPSDGAGKHWWRKLGPSDFLSHQLADPVGTYAKPSPW